MDIIFDFLLSEQFLFFVLVGFVAQFIDGSMGMAYGISANSLLLSLGVSPIQSSASIHIAEVFTTGISGLSHYGFGNVDLSLVKRLIIPGVIGAICGAWLLTKLPVDMIKTFVSIYLLIMGSVILIKAYSNKDQPKKVTHRIVPLGLMGGFFDAAGGGGWGPIVASTLVSKGSIPRLAVGTVNAAEFFIALASSLTFILTIVTIKWDIVAGLAIGGAIAAPFAAYFSSKIPSKLFMVLIGLIIILLSIRNLINFT
jgi:uncharacterized membrane protein YfcA